MGNRYSTPAMRLFFRLLGLVCALFFVISPLVALVAKLRLRSSGDLGSFEQSDELHLANIFGGSEITSSAQAFRGGSIINWYGGTQLDLRGATLAPGGADLVVRDLFGGIDIRVPPEWRVELRSRSFAGGSDASGVREDLSLDAPVLRVKALSVFGGLSISGKAKDRGDEAWPGDRAAAADNGVSAGEAPVA